MPHKKTPATMDGGKLREEPADKPQRERVHVRGWLSLGNLIAVRRIRFLVRIMFARIAYYLVNLLA